jgi:TRAP-type mannitol/chloroaromatic compound transport system permease small subunit
MMIGILLYEPVARNLFDQSCIWAVEMAQFTMAAYYLLGGGYSMILRGHVRMDLLYGRWSDKKKAKMDAITGLFLIFYLVFLLYMAPIPARNTRSCTGRKTDRHGHRIWHPLKSS